MDRNNTNFQLEIFNYLKSVQDKKDDNLFYYQLIVKEYFVKNLDIRGILLFHQPGRGKTRTTGASLKSLFEIPEFKDWKILAIAPSNVHHQFVDEMNVLGFKNKITFISLKSSTLMKQVRKTTLGVEDDDLELSITDELKTLEKTVVFIDEAHNIFNSICNSSKNAMDLYDMIMNTKNIKLIFMSGSPIINEIFELVPCFNMLAGFKLFPESKADFDKYFINDDRSHMINKEKFKNRILGLVSYYGDWIAEPDTTNLPEELETLVIKVSMSTKQYIVYTGYRDKEKEESSFKGARQTVDRFKSNKSKSSYRVASRMASTLVPIKGATDADLNDRDSCPKLYETLAHVDKRKKQKGVIYSDFVENCGIKSFGRLLELQGWEEWVPNKMDINSINKNPRRFVYLHSGVSEADRVKAIQDFNNPINMYGEYIHLMLMGPSGSEGIHLTDSRYVIILGPFFNYTRIDQIRFRIKRILSHKNLPAKDRTMQLIILLADYPKDLEASKRKEPTTDIYLLERAKKEKMLHLEAYKLMIEGSIDCSIHAAKLSKSRKERINCKMCAPTGQQLWDPSLDIDIQLPDPCQPPETETIKTKSLVLETRDGEIKFGYHKSKDGEYEFYKFNPDMKAYFKVPRDYEYWDQLMEAV